MCSAVIMAGGRSERMRATLAPTHKALVPVLGVPMIERNLSTLLKHGFDEIFVAVSASEFEVAEYVRNRGANLATALGARLHLYEEKEPLGTIGAAGTLDIHTEHLLVVNVDNLSTLDLRSLVNHHIRQAAALTIATHVEKFRIPFGEVVVRDGAVSEYREKPSFDVLLSSGTYVLSSRARTYIQKGERTDIPDLFRMLSKHCQKIAAFSHSSAWIDVNDAASILMAERLIIEHPTSFQHSQPR